MWLEQTADSLSQRDVSMKVSLPGQALRTWKPRGVWHLPGIDRTDFWEVRKNLSIIVTEEPGCNGKVLLLWTRWVYHFNCIRWPNSNMLFWIRVTTLKLVCTSFHVYLPRRMILIGCLKVKLVTLLIEHISCSWKMYMELHLWVIFYV